MLLLGHLTKFRRQSEVVVLDFRESLPVACVLCLQQRIAQLNDGALVLDPRAARRNACPLAKTEAVSRSEIRTHFMVDILSYARRPQHNKSLEIS